jgi:hypothetical protein
MEQQQEDIMDKSENKALETQTTENVTEQPKTVLGALLDLGASWASHGLNAGKFTLENSARMLDKTAKAVEGFARDFEKNKKTAG